MSADELAACVAESITQASTLFTGTLDAPVLRHTAHVVADTIGVSIAGGRTPEMIRLRENADEPGGAVPGPGGATVLVAGAAPAQAEQAAFLNGTAGGFLELDEGTRPTGHPGMHIVPAALAAAEVARRPGAELLAAVVAGYEVSARLFAAFQLRPPTHPHGHLAGVGAAVSVALLLRADPAAVAAIVATTPTVPVWNACYAGATARNTAMGLSAQATLRAIRLHRAGFTGTLESVPALFGEVTGKTVDLDALTAPAYPARPRIMHNYFKRHSACALTHGAVDAVLSMPAIPVDSIREVEVRTLANNLKLDRQAAPNDLSARFSLPYAVAAALTRRESMTATFDYDPTVARLAEKVRVTHGPELDRSWPEHAPTEVVVRAGDTVSATVRDPRGHHHDPLSADELRAKFTELVGDPAPELWERLLDLAALDDCAEALRPLRLVKPV